MPMIGAVGNRGLDPFWRELDSSGQGWHRNADLVPVVARFAGR